jgi:hypothetical protein
VNEKVACKSGKTIKPKWFFQLNLQDLMKEKGNGGKESYAAATDDTSTFSVKQNQIDIFN